MKQMLCIALALTAVSPALAQSGAGEREIRHVVAQESTAKLGPFESLDRDADGALSWEEVRNAMVRLFHDADHDSNGSLSGDEIIFSERLHKLADRNSDGAVDAREAMAETAAVFNLADTNEDGKLSREETTVAKQNEGIR
jgi:Ca2+-binding EF-hand superfamily protein